MADEYERSHAIRFLVWQPMKLAVLACRHQFIGEFWWCVLTQGRKKLDPERWNLRGPYRERPASDENKRSLCRLWIL